jgi:hypothetical protein
MPGVKCLHQESDCNAKAPFPEFQRKSTHYGFVTVFQASISL